MRKLFLFYFALSFSQGSNSYALIMPLTRSKSPSRVMRLEDAMESDFHHSSETPLVLSQKDIERLSSMRRRQKILPLLISPQSLIPGQTIELGCMDNKFLCMRQSLRHNDEIAIIGMHPHKPEEPLPIGVSAIVREINLNSIKVEATEVVDVQGKPWWDAVRSCFMAHLEVARDDMVLKGHHYREAKKWFDEIPILVKRLHEMLGYDRLPGMPKPFSDNYTHRAFAVASMMNPTQPRTKAICVDIRPALLSCRNDHDRLHLVHTALKSSIQKLKGKEH
jgi:hypothetical protein